MIPTRPWQLAIPQPSWGSDRVYIVDPEGRQVIGAALDRDLAELIIKAVNEQERCPLCADIHPLGRCVG